MKKSELKKIIRESIKELQIGYEQHTLFGMGENITACIPVSKECNSQAECVDKDGNRCGDCINIGAPHHEEPGICTTKSYDKFAPRDTQMDKYKR